MTVIGGLAALIGVAFGTTEGVLTDTAAERRRRRIGGYTSMGVGIALVGGGVALIVVGSKRKREAKAAAAEKARNVSVLPQFGPHGGGFGLTGRF